MSNKEINGVTKPIFYPCSPSRRRCSYTLQQRTSPAAPWEQCQKYTTKKGVSPCPKTHLSANNIMAAHNSNQSKKMRDAQRVKVNGRGWRKINWRRFRQIQQTKQYRQTHGCKGGISTTPAAIRALLTSQLPPLPITCKQKNIRLPPPPSPYIRYI